MEKGKLGIVRVSASKWVAVEYVEDGDYIIPFFKLLSSWSAVSHKELTHLKESVSMVNHFGMDEYIKMRNENPDKYKY